MFESSKDLLSVKEMQELLGVSKNTAYDLVRKNKIKCFRLGGRWKIPKQALEDYVCSESSTKRDHSSCS